MISSYKYCPSCHFLPLTATIPLPFPAYPLPPLASALHPVHVETWGRWPLCLTLIPAPLELCTILHCTALPPKADAAATPTVHVYISLPLSAFSYYSLALIQHTFFIIICSPFPASWGWQRARRRCEQVQGHSWTETYQRTLAGETGFQKSWETEQDFCCCQQRNIKGDGYGNCPHLIIIYWIDLLKNVILYPINTWFQHVD